jgi:hypothetical protein
MVISHPRSLSGTCSGLRPAAIEVNPRTASWPVEPAPPLGSEGGQAPTRAPSTLDQGLIEQEARGPCSAPDAPLAGALLLPLPASDRAEGNSQSPAQRGALAPRAAPGLSAPGQRDGDHRSHPPDGGDAEQHGPGEQE